SAIDIRNSVFMDFQRGIYIDGSACENNATNGLILYKNNLVAGNVNGKVTEKNAGSSFNAPAWFASNNNDSLASTAGILTTPYNYLAPDYRPAVSSPLLTGSDFTGLVGLEELNGQFGMSVYPNPSNEKVAVFLESMNDNEVSIQLFNTNGNLVKSIDNIQISNGTTQVDIELSELNGGVYYVVANSGIGSKTIKLIVLN
ncbi:MAG TPA: T9SS type A sorting domain-containing protein, partial [Fluviicola sp.]|nr:T9SS type A sorting domain-containing protein [Fluviicola sp.]